MGVFLSLVGLALFIYLYFKFNSLGRKNEDLIDIIKKLETRIKHLELQQPVSENENKETIQKEVAKTTTYKEEIPKLSFVVTEEEEENEDEVIVPEIKPAVLTNPKPVLQNNVTYTNRYQSQNTAKQVQPEVPKIKKRNEIWAKLEKQFIENWTGILGSVILVIGVGFLGIYAALKISAIGRFFLISGFAAFLSGLFIYLHKKQEWVKLALWLRSSAGAIFLFACAGSVSIPGLKWVESQSMQLFILSSGIFVNLFLGYIGKNQGLASLHILLSLVGVWIIPSSPMQLIVGGIITLFGIALTYREKWDYHLLLTISSFFVFHLFYWQSLNHVISAFDRINGIVIILVVGLAVALVHYRNAYSKKTFERIPFFVHLVNWLYFGLSLYLYSNGSQLSTFALAGGSVAAFILAQRAKKLNIRWLFLTDTLIAQLTAILALITLSRWEVNQSIIFATIFAECLLFLTIAQKEKDVLLYKIGSVTINLFAIVLLYFSFAHFDISNHTLLYEQAFSLLIPAIMGTAFLFYANKTNTLDIKGLYAFFNIELKGKNKHPFLGILVGLLFVGYYIQLIAFTWSIYTVVALLALLLFVRNKIQSVEIALISIIFLVGSHIVNWVELYRIHGEPALQLILFGLPILITSALSIKYSFVKVISKYLNWVGVYLFSIQLAILTFLLLQPLSVLAVSCGWLILSLFAIIIVKLISNNSARYQYIDRYILHMGYILIGLFLIRHISVNLHTEEAWGPLKGRTGVEMIAFVVFMFWAIAGNKGNATYKSWKYLYPVMVELVLLFSLFSLSLEFGTSYLPLIWLGIAGILLFLSHWRQNNLGRLAFYSFVLYIASIIKELFNYHHILTDAINKPAFPNQDLIIALISIVVSIGYLVLFYKRAKLLNNNWPSLVKFLKPFEQILGKSAAFIGIYALGVFLLMISYFMFASVSEIIPGVIWLLLSAVFATLALYCNQKQFNFSNVDRYLLHLTYLFIVAFIIRHVLVHIQLESYVGIFKTRLLIEILAMGVFTYCATLKKPVASTYKSWDYLHPLLIELLIVFAILTIALEIQAVWQPIIWIAMSFVFAILGNTKYEKLSRLLFYSLIMYWVAAFQTVFITSSYVVPGNEIYVQPWIFGTVSLLFQFAFLLYFYLKCNFEKIVLPKSLLFFTGLITKVQKQKNVYVFYPLIICTAIFFYWTFDKSLLTLLWTIECLAIFILSIILKKQHFRYVALGALAMCIIRLVFFDMAKSGTLTRAVVFLSVGIIMLLMNSLYNKFKNRFE